MEEHRSPLGGADAFGYAVVVDPGGHSPGNAPLHSRAPGRVLLSTNEGGLKISDNGGEKWDTATGTQSREVRQVAFDLDPTDLQVMYVRSEAHGGGGVYKSRDGGDHWSTANEGIESVAVFALAMDPNEPAVLYVTGPEGTYKTTCGGESAKTGRGPRPHDE